jgi:putative exporter of polyketide antibiotics
MWIAATLTCMGLVSGAHGLVPGGVAFSWLQIAATLFGGLLAALVWLPLLECSLRRRRFSFAR